MFPIRPPPPKSPTPLSLRSNRSKKFSLPRLSPSSQVAIESIRISLEPLSSPSDPLISLDSKFLCAIVTSSRKSSYKVYGQRRGDFSIISLNSPLPHRSTCHRSPQILQRCTSIIMPKSRSWIPKSKGEFPNLAPRIQEIQGFLLMSFTLSFQLFCIMYTHMNRLKVLKMIFTHGQLKFMLLIWIHIFKES